MHVRQSHEMIGRRWQGLCRVLATATARLGKNGDFSVTAIARCDRDCWHTDLVAARSWLSDNVGHIMLA